MIKSGDLDAAVPSACCARRCCRRDVDRLRASHPHADRNYRQHRRAVGPSLRVRGRIGVVVSGIAARSAAARSGRDVERVRRTCRPDHDRPAGRLGVPVAHRAHRRIRTESRRGTARMGGRGSDAGRHVGVREVGLTAPARDLLLVPLHAAGLVGPALAAASRGARRNLLDLAELSLRARAAGSTSRRGDRLVGRVLATASGTLPHRPELRGRIRVHRARTLPFRALLEDAPVEVFRGVHRCSDDRGGLALLLHSCASRAP